jgi:IS5 family transposase
MMGKRQTTEPKLFYTQLNLSDRIGPRNPLRAIASAVDFCWIRHEVAELYGINGHESIDPIVILKLHFLLFFENVPSVRLLMERLSERLDWLWFCGYDLDSTIPDHSVLSKARRRWGREVFAQFFRRVLEQCVAEGLVDGSVLHVDGSLISANASLDSVGPRLELLGGELFDRLEEQETQEEHDKEQDDPPPSKVSSTDPDARFRRKNGKLTLGYQEVRAVDDKHGIITASVTVDAGTEESHQMEPVLQQHEEHMGRAARTVVADKKFGTGENYQRMRQANQRPCIPHAKRTVHRGRIGADQFTYLSEDDCYLCPQGQKLPYSSYSRSKRAHLYKAPAKVCRACPLRARCAGCRGRILWRHQDQDAIEWADRLWSREHRRRLMRRRKHVVEGSFADATNHHGYKRARWRGLGSVAVQNLLIAAIQNMRKLVRYARKRPPALAIRLNVAINSTPASDGTCIFCLKRFCRLVECVWSLVQPQSAV